MSTSESFWLTSEEFDAEHGRHGLYPAGIDTADLRVFGNADRTVFVTVVNIPGFLPRSALIEAIRRAGLEYIPAGK